MSADLTHQNLHLGCLKFRDLGFANPKEAPTLNPLLATRLRSYLCDFCHLSHRRRVKVGSVRQSDRIDHFGELPELRFSRWRGLDHS